MKLYELTQEQQCLYDLLESGEAVNEDGEVDPVIFEQLKLNGAELKEKALATAIVIKQLESDAEQLKNEKLVLEKRQSSAEKYARGLKKYLADCLIAAGIDKTSNSKVAISFKKKPYVDIVDESLIPEDYLRIKKEPMKTDIQKAIENGLTIAGAEIKERKNIQIK